MKASFAGSMISALLYRSRSLARGWMWWYSILYVPSWLRHYQRVRLDGLIDILTEELDPLDELFGEMGRLVERYHETATRLSLNSDAPRRVYRRTSDVLLGRKV